MAKNNKPTAAENKGEENKPKRDYSERRWLKPTRRAKGYAEERKLTIHKYGDKEGQPLTEYEKGLRSGYLFCMSDHAGHFKFKKALDEGKSYEEAIAISKVIGKKGKPKSDDAA